MFAVGFRRDELRQFRDLIQQRWGIHISAEKDYLVEAKLRKALDATGLASAEQLLQSQDEVILGRIAQAVTTNHTFFFREAEHFDALLADAKKKALRRMTIWSAAASSGEECYSLAIRLLEEGFDDFQILASDIDHRVLDTLNEGLYPEFRLQNVSADLKRRYFSAPEVKRGVTWYRIREDLRDRVAIKVLNLLEPHHFAHPFDYIFLRNVLIYFDHPTQGRVIDEICRSLKPDGLLFLGHSESLMAIPHRHPLDQVDASVYRNRHHGGRHALE